MVLDAGVVVVVGVTAVALETADIANLGELVEAPPVVQAAVAVVLVVVAV